MEGGCGRRVAVLGRAGKGGHTDWGAKNPVATGACMGILAGGQGFWPNHGVAKVFGADVLVTIVGGRVKTGKRGGPGYGT